MSDNKMPILGSRVYDRIYVIEPTLKAYEKKDNIKRSETLKVPFVVMDWYDVQYENYKYVTWLENDETFHIKIIIYDFLYAEIVFPQNNLERI